MPDIQDDNNARNDTSIMWACQFLNCIIGCEACKIKRLSIMHVRIITPVRLIE